MNSNNTSGTASMCRHWNAQGIILHVISGLCNKHIITMRCWLQYTLPAQRYSCSYPAASVQAVPDMAYSATTTNTVQGQRCSHCSCQCLTCCNKCCHCLC